MDKPTYGEHWPNYIKFLKWAIKYKHISWNNVYDVIILKTSKEIIWIAAIVDDDQNVKKKLGLEWIFIWWVNINPKYRLNWFWKKLVWETLNHIKKYYKWNIWLFTDNPIAKHIYTQYWFKVVWEIVNKYGDKEELMKKILLSTGIK